MLLLCPEKGTGRPKNFDHNCKHDAFIDLYTSELPCVYLIKKFAISSPFSWMQHKSAKYLFTILWYYFEINKTSLMCVYTIFWLKKKRICFAECVFSFALPLSYVKVANAILDPFTYRASTIQFRLMCIKLWSVLKEDNKGLSYLWQKPFL